MVLVESKFGEVWVKFSYHHPCYLEVLYIHGFMGQLDPYITHVAKYVDGVIAEKSILPIHGLSFDV